MGTYQEAQLLEPIFPFLYLFFFFGFFRPTYTRTYFSVFFFNTALYATSQIPLLEGMLGFDPEL
jgi:hypothetical protein